MSLCSSLNTNNIETARTIVALQDRIAYANAKLAAAREAQDQDLIWEYGDHAEYLGDLLREAQAQ